MITTLLIQVFISTVCLLTGFLVYEVADREEKNRPWLVYLLTGLLTIACFSQLLSLFVPVNGTSTISTLTGIVLLAIFRRKTLVPTIRKVFRIPGPLSFWPSLMAAAAWLLILVLNSGPVTMDDTHSYHIQMVRWVHEYGTVPGIANLHERFGFNSSWFTAISFFLFPTGSGDHFTALNGCLSFWFLLFCLQQSTRIHSLSLHRTGWLLLIALILFCWPMIRGSATNTNYDFITAVCVFTLFAWTCSEKATPRFEWLYWPVMLFTVRIINYPLLLCSAWVLAGLIRQKKWKPLLAFPFVACLILGAFFARNILLSGYPFYPSAAFDWFKPDWKVDRAIITQLQDFIKYFNRVNVMHMNLEETRQLAFPQWTVKWFQYLFKYDKPLVLASAAGLIVYWLQWKKRVRDASPAVHFFIGVMLLQLASWFFIAPDPRFAYGSLLVLVLVLLQSAEPLFRLTEKIPVRYFPPSLFAVLLLFSVQKWRDPVYRNTVNPATLPTPPVSTIRIGNINMHIPEKILDNWNPRCYDTELPCLYIVDPRLECRGQRIDDGFRLAK